MAHLLPWIVLISAALGASYTALTSSGTGRLWHVDTVELRRQRRFEHVLSCHVDALQLARRQAAAPLDNPPGTSACTPAEPLQGVHEPWVPPFHP
ncbi:hypothetical protein ACFY7H_22320 [Streptomyces sp. NPDC012794]|uniref:hypothetical protein n=1 Tax=Streptomyces sp. NPDC012794 TaxID=3364850 RepID=UPI00367C3B15